MWLNPVPQGRVRMSALNAKALAKSALPCATCGGTGKVTEGIGGG